jgi:hypothetical protein
MELLQWRADGIWLWSKEMAWLAYAWDLCEIRCLCEISLCEIVFPLGGALGGFIYAAS